MRVSEHWGLRSPFESVLSKVLKRTAIQGRMFLLLGD